MDERVSHLLTAIGAAIGAVGLSFVGLYLKFRTALAKVRTLNQEAQQVDRKARQDDYDFMSSRMQDAIDTLTADARKSLEREIGHVAKIATLETENLFLKNTIDDLRAGR